MALLLLNLPYGVELEMLVLILLVALLPTVLIYWHASRRNNPHPYVWAGAMFVAALLGNVVGLVVVAVLYYVVGREQAHRAKRV